MKEVRPNYDIREIEEIAKGISLIGAHTNARPKCETSAGLWTDRDDLDAVLRMMDGGRMSAKELIFEYHAPEEAQAIYDRLANERCFPVISVRR